MKIWRSNSFSFQNSLTLKNLNASLSLATKSPNCFKWANFSTATGKFTPKPGMPSIEELRAYSKTRRHKETDLLDEIKVPFKLPGRTAAQSERLYRIGVMTDSLESIEKDVTVIRKLAKTDIFKNFLFSYKYPDDVKSEVILKSLGDTVCKATRLFIEDLIGSKKFHELDSILSGFERLMRAYRQETMVSVASAKPLNQDELIEVCSIARALVGPKGKVILQCRVESKLIDGFVVRAAGKTHDESYLSRQEFLTQRFRADFNAEANRLSIKNPFA